MLEVVVSLTVSKVGNVASAFIVEAFHKRWRNNKDN